MPSLRAYVFQCITNYGIRDTVPLDHETKDMQDFPFPGPDIKAATYSVTQLPFMLPDGNYNRGHSGLWRTHHSCHVVQWETLPLAWTVFRCLHCQLHIFGWFMCTLSEASSGTQHCSNEFHIMHCSLKSWRLSIYSRWVYFPLNCFKVRRNHLSN